MMIDLNLFICASVCFHSLNSSCASVGPNHFPCIDHFLFNKRLSHCIVGGDVIDSGINKSDYSPFVINLKAETCTRLTNQHMLKSNSKHYKLRWDKSDLDAYYNVSCVMLSTVGSEVLCNSQFPNNIDNSIVDHLYYG